jgi:hypothetical protein
MRRKINLIIDDLEESVYLLELDGFERVPFFIKEAIQRLREVEHLENTIESLKIENQNLRDTISSNEKGQNH